MFLISIFLLLINDLYLKYEYHNSLTGKLSDFVGLFAFPYFFSCLLRKKVKLIYLFTAIFFAIWKSQFSQPIFDFVNSIGIGINRTVDYTDFIALLILPFSYWYYKKSNFQLLWVPSKILKPIVIGSSMFSFIATTLPSEVGELEMKSDLEVDLNIAMEKAKETFDYYDSGQEGKYIYRVEIPDKRASVTTLIEIEEGDNGLTRVKLDSILTYQIESKSIFLGGIKEKDKNYLENLSRSEIEKLFEEQVRRQSGKK